LDHNSSTAELMYTWQRNAP